MKNLLVSIIIPVFNSESFLDKCIQSIIHQTYENIEIILVNDGSTDSSGAICDEYAIIDNRIKVIHKVNGGLVSSRKSGIKLSTGEYVLYVDGDDWIELDLIQTYIEQVNKYNADIVISAHNVNLEGRIEIITNTLPTGYYDKSRIVTEIYPKMMYTGKFSQFGIFSYSWGKLYRRNILISNQLKVREDITIGEDALCLYPTILDSNAIVILDTPYYHYRQRADSLIKTLRTIEISKMENIYKDLKEIFRNKDVLDTMIIQLQYYLLSLLIVNTEGPNDIISSDSYPFNDIKSGSNVVIYGGGTFGQHLYKKISKCKTYNIVSWIDERHHYYSKLNLPVTDFTNINSTEYDMILIALVDEDNSNHAVMKLLECGVDRQKIMQLPYYGKQNIQKLLLKYKIDL
jgi:glycosyltransferase involved in cell wall biosynthesis